MEWRCFIPNLTGSAGKESLKRVPIATVGFGLAR